MSAWLRDERVAVVDFETTGMGPQHGARATEVGLVLIEGGRIVDQYASLMHSGVPVPPFIERLTGISNEMLERAPGAREVISHAHALTGGCTLVAHNAGFDRSFWVAELLRAGIAAQEQAFVCTVKLARRLYPDAPNCKLGTLAAWQQLPDHGPAHRALADALTTAQLWLRMGEHLAERLREPLAGAPISLALMSELQNHPVSRWPQLARRVRDSLQTTLPV